MILKVYFHEGDSADVFLFVFACCCPQSEANSAAMFGKLMTIASKC